ncbi:MAG: CvpA family protein [Planctomycetota bacterium]
MDLAIDIILVGVVGLLTYLIAQDGPWSAVLTFFAVVFSGLLAMNFFEPLAGILGKQSSWLEPRADIISLLGLFALFVFLIRLGLDHIAPTNLELPDVAYKIGQWAFGFATAYVTMAILATALHTAPLPRKFLGFTPERKNFLGVTSPDVQWLGFTQYVTEHVFARRVLANDALTRYRSFDGKLEHFPESHQLDVLPTFIIRYATRRQRLSGEMPMAAAAPIVVPSSGGGGSTVGPGF